MHSKYIDSGNKKVIRRHWNSAAVFTDAWHPGINEQELNETELFPGELSASVYTVGCYLVRSAQRVYKMHEPGYGPELETPASKEETEFVRECVGNRNVEDYVSGLKLLCLPLLRPPWEHDNLFTVHEISAKHHSDTAAQFTFICKAAHDRCVRPEASSIRGIRMWSESIGCICTAKKHIWISNECASLFVLNIYQGDYYCQHWYEFDPAGKTTEL